MSVNIAPVLRSKSDLDKKSKKTPKMLKKLSKLTVFVVSLTDHHEALFDRIEGLNEACLGVKTPILDGQRAIFVGFYTQNRIK